MMATSKDTDIQISMDGKGRVFDNFIERLWRTVKVEEVYLRDYQTVTKAAYSLGRYFEFYNNRIALRAPSPAASCQPPRFTRSGAAGEARAGAMNPP